MKKALHPQIALWTAALLIASNAFACDPMPVRHFLPEVDDAALNR